MLKIEKRVEKRKESVTNMQCLTTSFSDFRTKVTWILFLLSYKTISRLKGGGGWLGGSTTCYGKCFKSNASCIEGQGEHTVPSIRPIFRHTSSRRYNDVFPTFLRSKKDV